MKREQMNSNTEFKIHRQNGYTIMPNKLLRDMNLSLKSKALLSLMLSLPEDWDYSVVGLTEIVKEGYELNEEKMWFEIKEDGEVIKATMKDDQIIKEMR